MELFIIILFFIVVLPLMFFAAKANVDRHFQLRDSIKERGLEYCLAELALAQTTERKDAIKAAIQELKREL